MNKERRDTIIILAIIIIIQVASLFYWQSKKCNYFIDEFYSMQTANYFLDKNATDNVTERYMINRPQFRFNKWIKSGPFYKTFVVSPKESLLYAPFTTKIKLLLTQRNYMGILNMLMTTRDGNAKPLPGFLFNVFIVILTQILIYIIAVRLGISRNMSLLAVCFYGFSTRVADMAIYIRFYIFTTFLFLIAVYLHILIDKNDSIKRNLLYEFLSLFLLYLAYKNSELIFILTGLLIAGFSAVLIMKRQFRKAACYFFPVFIPGLIYALRKTDFITVMFHPELYAAKRGARGRIADVILNSSIRDIFTRFSNQVYSTFTGLFGSTLIFQILLLMIVLLTVPYLIRKRRRKESLFSEKSNFPLILVFLLMSVIYAFALAIGGLLSVRYFAFLVPVLALSLIKILDSLIDINFRNILFSAVLFCILSNIIFTYYNEDLYYMYPNDKPFIYALKDYRDLPVMEIMPKKVYINAICYESIFYMGKGNRFYFTKSAKKLEKETDLPDEFLLWNVKTYNPKKYRKALKKKGYTIRRLAVSHVSLVYLVTLKDNDSQLQENNTNEQN